MPQPFSSAKVTLSYPLYACDFNPTDATRLVVGGGGGAGKSGVGNKITILDTSEFATSSDGAGNLLATTAEIDLSKQEDNVTSLAVGQTKAGATLVYAGINSSVIERENGKNDHFRVFKLEDAAKSIKGQRYKISELARLKLFEKSGLETYQRVLRLSKPFPGSAQLGAAATAFGSDGEEIVLFETTGLASGTPNIRGRIKVDQEAEDVDVIQTGTDEYQFVYCSKYDILMKTISSKTNAEAPINITPATAEHQREDQPVFRSIRFLTPKFLMVLINLAGRKGAFMQFLRLPSKGNERASQAFSIRLPAHVRQATGLAICNLTPRKFPSEEQGYAQFALAVAGQDMSISVYAFEHQREANISMITEPVLLQTLNEVHPFQITGLTLSTFTPPAEEISPQSIKLASISAGNTVVVHSIPLSPLPETSPVRFIARGSRDKKIVTFPLISTIIITLLLAFVTQILLEVRSGKPTFLNAAKYVAPDIQEWIKVDDPILNGVFGTPKPLISSPSSTTTITTTTTTTVPPSTESTEKSFASVIEELIAQQAGKTSEDGKSPVILIQEHPVDPFSQQETNPELKSSIKANLHDEEIHGPHGGRTWEELTHEERERWTQKLKDAGHWAEDFGETIFKGVVWSMAGAAVGGAVGG